MQAERKKMSQELVDKTRDLEPGERVLLARHPNRPHIEDFVENVFTDFFEQKGDHLYDEDRSIFGGIARFHGRPVTVLGHKKGRGMEENIACNFGMPCPEGYRKAKRLMEQAEKFHRPIITFIDTPGAYPGLEAEEHGQGEAIAKNLAFMSSLHVPVISIVSGEGNSGGALAIGVANKILMLENAIYSVLSPEGFATILWKDSTRAGEAAKVMKLTAEDLKEAGVCDEIIPEVPGGAQENPVALYKEVEKALEKILSAYESMSPEQIREDRLKKYRNI
ncbi:acetyl-CoA carboxylase, carboxyl transferase, alpha subunit [Oribacterium sp. oral taxon 108 str. F0425]|nr:acetyl-CoA carboxylase, carboxyl transferase, alpha subunit [Oribacterium sp. oral taxon 108 str. F0425]